MSPPDDLDAVATRRALERLLLDAPEIGGGLPAGFLDGAQTFVALLLAANRRLNLTRITAPDEVARLHLLDSLAALPILDRLGSSVAIDLGSGGGLPGVPLALARPSTRWTLVESVGKKATVLREIAAALALANVTVLAERAELLGRDPRHRERYDLVTARAVAALPVLAELGMPLVRIGGTMLSWKGPLSGSDEEVRRGRTAIGEVGGGALRLMAPGPVALGGHTLVLVDKVRPTPGRFPRRPGEPGRHPLG